MSAWTELFAMVAAAGAALGVSGRLLQVAFRRLRRAYRYVQVQLAALDELKPNGGGSIKDKVNELADTSARHFKRVDEDLARHDRQFEKVEFDIERMKGGG